MFLDLFIYLFTHSLTPPIKTMSNILRKWFPDTKSWGSKSHEETQNNDDDDDRLGCEIKDLVEWGDHSIKNYFQAVNIEYSPKFKHSRQ